MADRTERFVPNEAPRVETQLEPAREARPAGKRRRIAPPPRGQPATVAEAINELSDGLSTLLRGHLQLARVEMKQEMRSVAKDVALEFAGAPAALLGFLLLTVAAALALALLLPYWAAFLIVGGLVFLTGMGLMGWGAARLRKQKIDLPASSSELKRDRDWAPTLRESPDRLRENLH
ncbi:MAG: phage holin family protein [Myxococcales bacterium]